MRVVKTTDAATRFGGAYYADPDSTSVVVALIVNEGPEEASAQIASPRGLRVSDRDPRLLSPAGSRQPQFAQPTHRAVRDLDLLTVELAPDLAGPVDAVVWPDASAPPRL
jgi:hypothetical protein